MSSFWKKSIITGLILYIALVYLIAGPWIDTIITGLIFYFIPYLIIWFVLSLLLRTLNNSKAPSWLKAALIGSCIFIILEAVMVLGSLSYGGDVGVMTDNIYFFMPSGYLHNFLFPNSYVISGWFMIVDLVFFAILAATISQIINSINRRKS